ncbi:hypothetical protein ACWGI8_05280 [Streptomyces sp. NPDC054841]
MARISKGRQRQRFWIVLGAAVALVIPLALTVGGVLQGTGTDQSVVQAERRGVRYLGPLTRLLAVLADEQSAAVQSRPRSPKRLTAAISAVDGVDLAEGKKLQVNQLWADLRPRAEALERHDETGRTAYRDYAIVVDLVTQLLIKVNDNSNLILDPGLDSYYMMDTLSLKLPLILTDAGRLADLVHLTETGGKKGIPDRDQIFALRYQIARNADSVGTGLRKSFTSTSSGSLGPALLGKVDGFSKAAAVLAPDTSLVDAPANFPKAAALAESRQELRDTIVELDEAGLVELDKLLQMREQDIGATRLGTLAGSGGCLLIGTGLLWTALRYSTPTPVEKDADDAPTTIEARHRSARHAHAQRESSADASKPKWLPPGSAGAGSFAEAAPRQGELT